MNTGIFLNKHVGIENKKKAVLTLIIPGRPA
jgi:hypothetical protein